MFWYLLNILSIVIAWLWPTSNCTTYDGTDIYDNTNTVNRLRAKRTCIVGTLNWILLSGLRSIDIGADTYGYKVYRFDVTITKSWGEILANFPLKYIYNYEIKDPGYTLLEKIFQIFSTNYQLWLIFIAIIFMIPMGVWIYKNSQNACVSWILFSTLFYSFFAITGHRQTIATSLVVWLGTMCIKERKLLLFLLIITVATTIHASAICFLPFYWLSQIKINKLTLAVYWGAILASFIERNQLLALLQSLVGYEEFQQDATAHAGAFFYLLMVFAIFITLFYKINNFENNNLNPISVNAVFLACFFAPLLLINPAFMRVVQYYSLFLLFLLPDTIQFFKHGRSQQLYIGGICLIMITLLVSDNPSYSFFSII